MVASPIRRVRTDHEKYSNKFDCRDCRGSGDGCSGARRRYADGLQGRAGGGRAIRRLVSARRYRHDQPAGQIDRQRAVHAGGAGGRQGVRHRNAVRSRRRLQVQRLVPRRRDRRISRQDRLPRPRRLSGRHQRLFRHQVGMAVPGQRLYRSRHLVVRHALRRRRHRLFAQHHRQLPRRRTSAR